MKTMWQNKLAFLEKLMYNVGAYESRVGMCALYTGMFRYQCQLDGELPLDEKPFGLRCIYRIPLLQIMGAAS